MIDGQKWLTTSNMSGAVPAAMSTTSFSWYPAHGMSSKTTSAFSCRLL